MLLKKHLGVVSTLAASAPDAAPDHERPFGQPTQLQKSRGREGGFIPAALLAGHFRNAPIDLNRNQRLRPGRA